MTDGLPDIGVLIAEGRLRPQDPDLTALRAMLDAAETDLEAANVILASSPSWAEAMLYEAGLRASRVVVQAAGYRISADRGHVTAIDAADALTDRIHHRRFVRLHRMRRMRHEFMYDIGRAPSESDLRQARIDVEALIDAAREAVDTAP